MPGHNHAKYQNVRVLPGAVMTCELQVNDAGDRSVYDGVPAPDIYVSLIRRER